MVNKAKGYKDNSRNLRGKTKGSMTAVRITRDDGTSAVLHINLRKESLDSGRQYLRLEVEGIPELLLFPDTKRIRGVGFAFTEAELIGGGL